MNPSSVRVRLVTPAPGAGTRRPRFADGGPFVLHTGLWAGRTLEEVAAEDPAAVRRWLTDPAYAPPGGESVEALAARAGSWLAGLGPGTHRVTADQAFTRAALVAALELPLPVFWRLDVRPGTETTLTGRSGRWNLVVGTPAHDPDPDPDPSPAPDPGSA
ncbi:histidine phosphatase family protein [Streptomyces sp. NPDC091268]|uniref:histidine phosphatase family protein n=1 Tax=Streptomyces sp. NPDC091268 TaxID=3365979 RepID=UPI00381D467D